MTGPDVTGGPVDQSKLGTITNGLEQDKEDLTESINGDRQMLGGGRSHSTASPTKGHHSANGDAVESQAEHSLSQENGKSNHDRNLQHESFIETVGSSDDPPTSKPGVVDADLELSPSPRPEAREEPPLNAADQEPSKDIPIRSQGHDIKHIQRAESQSSVATNSTQRPSSLSSMVFVVTALEKIASSKEARKRKQLGDSVQKALSAIKQGDQQLPDPDVIFHPLQLATQSPNINLTEIALDCIGKLISYSYFSAPASPEASTNPDPQRAPLIERAIDTICECFQGEATPIEVQQQIVKSLLGAVLNDKIIVHGAGLLTAIRQIYNIFIYSRSSQNQQVAQGSLTQMVGTVFERVKTRLASKEARLNLSNFASDKSAETESEVNLEEGMSGSDLPYGNGNAELEETSETASTAASFPSSGKGGEEKLTLQSFEHSKSFDDARINDNAPTMVTRSRNGRKPLQVLSARNASSSSAQEHSENTDAAEEDEEDEIYVKDAFLVFRSMCKLSTKILSPEQQQDIKSQNMRSKLLSLHLIRTLLDNNMVVFTSPLVTIKSSSSNEPTSFIQAVKQYLCLSLSRNGTSSVNRVFEVSCEIFWLMLRNMRVMLKVCPYPHHPAAETLLTLVMS